jgi:uncharacterized membrane protein (UPF0127 family)
MRRREKREKMQKTKTFKKIYFARSFLARLIGLQGRTVWPKRYGGIFFPKCGSVHTFFTFLRPDLVFLDKKGKILKIIASAKPWRVFFGPSKTYHCLELPRGNAKKLGLKAGIIIKATANTKSQSHQERH